MTDSKDSGKLARKKNHPPPGTPETPGVSPGANPGVKEYTSVLKSIEEQVGDHVVEVLQQPDTVAVLTTVVATRDGSQRIVSVGLDADMLEDVEGLFEEACAARDAPRVPCVGFHCFIKDRDAT